MSFQATRNPIVNLNSPLRGLLMLCMVVMAGCGSCQGGNSGCDPSQYGTSGCECRTDSAGCDTGLACNSGTCVPCGGEGQECCVAASATYCGGSLMCVMESGGELCRNCGDVGEACCNSSGSQVCNAGGNCMGGTCQSIAATACDAGGTVFSLGIETKQFCAVRVVDVRATSAQRAMECATASALFDPMTEVLTATPNLPIQDIEVCVETAAEGRRTTTVRAFGEYEAQRCARFTRCGSDGCLSVRLGACR
nr:hypothetical protein [Myxococcus fulvus]